MPPLLQTSAVLQPELADAAAVPTTRVSRASTGEPSASGRPAVLVVDDDPAACAVAVGMLARHGFDVTAAEGPREALAALEGECFEPALLLTDVDMPELTGFELAKEVRRRRPNVRVLLMSGGGGDCAESADSPPIVTKPYTMSRLVDAVRGSLAIDSDEQAA